MKISKFTRLTICFLILISNFADIYLAKEEVKRSKKSNSSLKSHIKNHLNSHLKTRSESEIRNAEGVQFHSRFTDLTSFSRNANQKIGLKAFNLNGNAHLMARCPKNSVLIKLIFEKRNDYVLDVGFNCRRDVKNISSLEESFSHRIESKSFDNTTPPNAVCPEGYALSGYEFRRMNVITAFTHYCTKVTNIHSTLSLNNQYYPKNIMSTIDPMERKAFSRFLTHTDIKVPKGQYKDGVINGIIFLRSAEQVYQLKKIPGTLSYSFTISKIGTKKR